MDVGASLSSFHARGTRKSHCWRRTPAAPYRILVFGGSQGARQINEAMIEATPSLDPELLEIFHQTGEADRERVTAAYADLIMQIDGTDAADLMN